MPFDISMEPFRGDLEALQKMAISSWQDEYGISSFPNLYRPGPWRCQGGPRAQQRVRLARVWERDELAWELDFPYVYEIQI